MILCVCMFMCVHVYVYVCVCVYAHMKVREQHSVSFLRCLPPLLLRQGLYWSETCLAGWAGWLASPRDHLVSISPVLGSQNQAQCLVLP